MQYCFVRLDSIHSQASCVQLTEPARAVLGSAQEQVPLLSAAAADAKQERKPLHWPRHLIGSVLKPDTLCCPADCRRCSKR